MPRTAFNQILTGDARELLADLPSNSVDLSFWSPPYFVGKSYEQDLAFDDWQSLVSTVVMEHRRILRHGGFLAVNIGDILCFPDPEMPRYLADKIHGKKHRVTHYEVLNMKNRYPGPSRYELASLLGRSESSLS